MNPSPASGARRPNILFFMCDQLTPFATSPYREGMALTPAFQRVADRGATFTSAYCNSPLCTPSRASMMAGRYCSQIGVYHNAGVLHADRPCLAHYLREADYHAVLSGKMHFIGPDQCHGFSERLTTDIYPADIAWVPDWSRGKAMGDELHAVYQSTAPLEGNKYQSYDEEASFRAIQWLRRYARSSRMHADPFFLCVSLTNPHHPYVAPEAMWELYEGREIPRPRVGPRPPDNWNDRWIQQALTLDEGFVPDKETQAARRGYFACTSFADSQLARLLETLERLGLADDTWVVIASDHGDMIGERGLWFKKLFYESSARVPLIVAPPGGMAPSRPAQPVSLVDLLPTFAEIGRTAAPEPDLPGRSLLPLMENPGAEPERHCIMEYMGTSVLGGIRMVRQGDFKYVSIHPEGEHEELLFDLAGDPDELCNRIGDAALQPVAGRLRALATADGWDGAAINRKVRADQRQRHFLRRAMEKKKTASFDYVPPPIEPADPEMFGLGLQDPRRP